MIIVCAWCDKTISGKRKNIISHGICENCFKYIMSDKSNLKELLSKFDVPVLVYENKTENIITANELALKVLDKNLEEIKNKKGGDVIECSFSKMGEGCGKNDYCLFGCSLRKAVLETMETGEPKRKIKSLHQIVQKNGKIQNTTIIFSTEKLNGKILIVLEDKIIEK